MLTTIKSNAWHQHMLCSVSKSIAKVLCVLICLVHSSSHNGPIADQIDWNFIWTFQARWLATKTNGYFHFQLISFLKWVSRENDFVETKRQRIKSILYLNFVNICVFSAHSMFNVQVHRGGRQIMIHEWWQPLSYCVYFIFIHSFFNIYTLLPLLKSLNIGVRPIIRLSFLSCLNFNIMSYFSFQTKHWEFSGLTTMSCKLNWLNKYVE